MKLLTRFALIFCVIVFGVLRDPASEQTQRAQAPPYQALTDKFFDLMRQDKTSAAVDYLFATNPALKKMSDQADALKLQFAKLRTIGGPYKSHTLLVESHVAGRYVYQHYFVAYELEPISLRITYYKPDAVWVCHSLEFDEKLSELVRKEADDNIRTERK